MKDDMDAKQTDAERALTRLRQVISLGALAVALVHILFPALAIDGITLALIVIAILPWLAPIVKSLELPGGWKLEFRDFQKAASRAETAGLLAPPTAARHDLFAFQTIADRDPNLALAGLRIEIEKRLTALAERKGIAPKGKGVGILLRQLSKAEVLTPEERSVLFDVVELLNSAVHGATVDERATEWAMTIGPRLLASLDDRLAQ